MKPIAASLSLLLAAGVLLAVFVLTEVYRDADGGPRFEADPGPVAAAPPGRDGPVPVPREPELAAAVERAKGELDAEKARTAALTGELAAAKRAAEAERAAAERRLDGERARSADLLRDLARARDRIARTFHGRVIEAGRRGAEDEALVDARIRHAAALEAGDDALPAAVRLGRSLPAADRPGEAADPAPPGPSSARLPDSPDRDAAAAWASLPDGTGAHVTVEYARGSEPARRRAFALSRTLQAEGLDVADPVDAPSPAKGGRVTYFYGTDRASAERVAGLCAAPSPIRGRLPARGRLPRPGTIGIAVAD